MKKLYSIICALCIMSCAFLHAQTECSTIAELKALAAGTKCVYVGNATTTYHYDDYGILMQDETGAILLLNKNLGASKAGDNDYTDVTTNMEITYVEGTFKKEDQMYGYIDYIDMKNTDIENIEINKKNVEFTPEKVSFDEFVTKLDEYKGIAVQFDEVNIRTVNNTINCEFYSLTSDATLSVPFNALIGTLPSKASVCGYIAVNYSGNIFKVGSKESIVPLAFSSIKELKNAITEYKDLNYEMQDTFAVSHVMTLGDKKLVYIQEKDNLYPDNYDHGLRIEVPATTDVVIGDSIVNIYGKFRPYVGDSISQKGASFFQNEATPIEVVGNGANCRAFANHIYTITGDNMQNAYRYESTLITISGGGIVKENDGSYSYVIEDEVGQGRQKIGFVIAGVEDLSAYDGVDCGVCGILDVANNYPEKQFTIIARNESDIIASNIRFETIEELIAAGELGSAITYEIVNPVLVTYKFAKTQNVSTYYFMVQDETAGIVVDLGVTAMDTILVGDSIMGLKGVYTNNLGRTTDFLAVDAVSRENIAIKNRGNEIDGIEVTFAEILADKKLYENRVVTVKGVENCKLYHEELNADEYEGCFVQGKDTIYYTTGSNAGDFIFYDYMDITGVVDNKIVGEYYSIWPLSQEHIIDLREAPTSVENAIMNARIYSNNQTIFVEATEGAVVRVFSMQGQCLYSNTIKDNSIEINNISENCVIILVDEIAYKLIVE